MLQSKRSFKSDTGGAGMVLLVVFVLALLLAGGLGFGRYNAIVTEDESVESAFTDIKNQYKRRYDLIPQLVETVKGAADFEKSTITAVTEARASVGQLQIDASDVDPAKLKQFFDAQTNLGGALTRLLATAERYPDLKATRNFQDLQTQIEGTENRIAVARTDYIESVRSYNVAIRRFPGNLVANLTGFEKREQLEFESDIEEVPDINF